MQHFVMTRASYGPEWPAETNRRRLRLMTAVTATLLQQQTELDWTWCVLLDQRDRYLNERVALIEDSAPHVLPVLWTPKTPGLTQHGGLLRVEAEGQLLMRQYLPSDDTVLQTRLDDDDGLATDALARFSDAVWPGVDERVILMMPVGYQVWDGKMQAVHHETNAMHALVTPPGDDLSVFGYSHRVAKTAAPVWVVDERPGWLWVRHRDTDSNARIATRPISSAVKDLFPIDWDELYRSWRQHD